MSYKKIPWWQPEIGKEEHKLIIKVLNDNYPNEGKLTYEFERRIEKLLGVKHAIAVTSCTAAIFISLKALGVGHGDEVVVPDLTFISTANAVSLTGAKPILCDVESSSLGLDPNSFEKLINNRTKAVIPVHVSGRASNITKIVSIAKKHKLFVVEDAAEGFYSKHKGKFLGTFGNTGCFSFSPAKTITTGQGGMVITNNSKLDRKLRELKDQGRPVRGTGGDDIHFSIGYNFKFTDMQAALGLGQLGYLEERIQRIKKTYKIYKKYLSEVKGVKLYGFDIENGEIPQWVDAYFDNRKSVDNYLSGLNIDSRRFWYPIHKQKPYKDLDEKFPISTLFSSKSLWLPSAFTLKDKEVKFVADSIVDCLRGSL